ncbi:MAG: YihY/virulence factor BrkB family protein [Victivallaceae bacterium]|nr:YihY/virulence factor BrkB family protein [Victivallaceae bacterium]
MKIFSFCWNLILDLFGIIKTSVQKSLSDNIPEKAMALTYNVFFAIVPMAALAVGIAKGFDLDEELIVAMNNYFAEQSEALKWIRSFADQTLKASGGVLAGIGVFILIFTATKLFISIENAINQVWGVSRNQGVLKRIPVYFTIMLLLPIMLVVLSSANALSQGWLVKMLPTGPTTQLLLLCFARSVSFLVTFSVFFMIYKLIPKLHVNAGAAIFAAVIGTILYLALQFFIVFAQQRLFSYNRIYGSFAVLPLFLIGIQYSWYVILFGAEVSHVAQDWKKTYKTKSDTQVRPSIELMLTQDLAVASLIAKSMTRTKENRGGCGITYNELMTKIQFSSRDFERCIDDLIKSGIVYAINDGETKFVMAEDPGDLSVRTCLERFFRNGRVDKNKSCNLAGASRILDGIWTTNADAMKANVREI